MLAAAAGLAIAAVTGPMGCFVVWRRMAYFGDSLAHSALLGVALGILAGVGASPGIVLVCLVFAMLLYWLEERGTLHLDTLLGILAHSALSFGIILISAMRLGIDLHAFLFGDILTVAPADLVAIFGGGAAVLAALLATREKMILMVVDADLARAEGVGTGAMKLLFLVLMTVVVAVAVRMVGVLLITSLLIIPAATARLMARSPEAMAATASLVGMAGVLAGLATSLAWDVPAGPAMVSSLAVLFAATVAGEALLGRAAGRPRRAGSPRGVDGR